WKDQGPSRSAVCFLWHCPYPHGRWALPTTAPYGARTFLSLAFRQAATTWPTPAKLIVREMPGDFFTQDTLYGKSFAFHKSDLPRASRFLESPMVGKKPRKD